MHRLLSQEHNSFLKLIMKRKLKLKMNLYCFHFAFDFQKKRCCRTSAGSFCNIGYDYTSITLYYKVIFSAPVNGTYEFMVMFVASYDKWTDLEIKMDGETICRAVSYHVNSGSSAMP